MSNEFVASLKDRKTSSQLTLTLEAWKNLKI